MPCPVHVLSVESSVLLPKSRNTTITSHTSPPFLQGNFAVTTYFSGRSAPLTSMLHFSGHAAVRSVSTSYVMDAGYAPVLIISLQSVSKDGACSRFKSPTVICKK